MRYGVTWPGQTEVIYDDYESFRRAVITRAAPLAVDLKTRLETGIQAMKEAHESDVPMLYNHYCKLENEYKVLLRVLAEAE